jgi:hypothetical protein
MEQLKQKFHEQFYSGNSEAKLADWTSVRHARDESTLDYFKWFNEIKRCSNLIISKKDLTDLAFRGMRSYLRVKLEGHIYLLLTQLQQFASVQENRIKNTKEIVRHTSREVHVIGHSLDSSNGENSEVLTTEFFWPSKTKYLAYDVLKLIHKNWQDLEFFFSLLRDLK